MKLQNMLPHMSNGVINVNGTHYQLDANGIVEVANEKDVQKLLANKAVWRCYIERNPIANITFELNTEKELLIEEEWPDPKITMSIRQLHAIADAYQVKYDNKTSKKVLVDLITAAMDGEE